MNEVDTMDLIDSSLLNSWKRSEQHAASMDKAKEAILEAHELKIIYDKHEQFIKRLHPAVEQLATTLKSSQSIVVLSDVSGILLNTVGDPSYLEETEKIYLQPGAQWSEDIHGTNSAGTIAIEKRPMAVVGTDHYLASHDNIYCVGSPIYNSKGKLTGVLNISGHATRYNPSLLHFIDIIARKIENNILFEEREDDMIISLQNELNPSFEALISIDNDKRITGMNRAAQEVLPIEGSSGVTIQLDELLVNADTLLDKSSSEMTFTIVNIKSQNYKKNFIASVLQRPSREIVSIPHFSKLTEKQKNKTVNKKQRIFPKMIGEDALFIHALNIAKKVAPTHYTISITGESGTGKDVLSHAIHQASDRYNKPFIALNCGGITKNLVESELFGYEPGSFTGAKREGHAGVFERANGGTLFLDEVAELPLHVQTTLLRVLQDFKVTRIGGNTPVKVDIRLITATHTDLWEKVQAGTFRDDLFYRLQGVHIELPPLRERTDRLQYAHYFLKEIKAELQLEAIRLEESANKLITTYDWPGNIRQLKSALREAAFFAGEGVIEAHHFPAYIVHSYRGNVKTPSLLQTMENKTIMRIVNKTEGNVSEAARILGIGRNTLYRKLARIRNDERDSK